MEFTNYFYKKTLSISPFRFVPLVNPSEIFLIFYKLISNIFFLKKKHTFFLLSHF